MDELTLNDGIRNFATDELIRGSIGRLNNHIFDNDSFIDYHSGDRVRFLPDGTVATLAVRREDELTRIEFPPDTFEESPYKDNIQLILRNVLLNRLDNGDNKDYLIDLFRQINRELTGKDTI